MLTKAVVTLITLSPQNSTSARNAVSMAILNVLHRIGTHRAPSEIAWEFTANIIMFMPSGLFLLLATVK